MGEITLLRNAFYKHYKHDPNGEDGNYMYQVLNLGHEKDSRKTFVVYRPLYKSSFVYQQNMQWDAKELSEWLKLIDDNNVRYAPLVGSEFLDCEQRVRDMYEEEPGKVSKLTIVLEQ